MAEGFGTLWQAAVFFPGQREGEQTVMRLLTEVTATKGSELPAGFYFNPRVARQWEARGLLAGDLTQLLSQIKGTPGSRTWLACMYINLLVRKLPNSGYFHASEETVHDWTVQNTKWAQLTAAAKANQRRKWLKELPARYNQSFPTYRYILIRYKQKNGQWGYIIHPKSAMTLEVASPPKQGSRAATPPHPPYQPPTDNLELYQLPEEDKVLFHAWEDAMRNAWKEGRGPTPDERKIIEAVAPVREKMGRRFAKFERLYDKPYRPPGTPEPPR